MGDKCVIDGRLQESCIGDNVVIEKDSLVKSTIIYDNVRIKPYTHLENCIIGSDCNIEKHVTMKNVVVGDGEVIGAGEDIEDERRWSNPIPDSYPEKQIGNPLQE